MERQLRLLANSIVKDVFDSEGKSTLNVYSTIYNTLYDVMTMVHNIQQWASKMYEDEVISIDEYNDLMKILEGGHEDV